VARERLIIEVTESGTRVVQRRLGGIGRAATGATSQVNLLRRALTFVGGALVLRESVRTLANFSQAMSTVKAVSGATADEFAELRDVARDLGATTRFSATQAAEGMVLLARAGFEVAETMEATGDVLLLAQAGGLDLASAADVAASTLRGFRLETDQASRVADVLAAAANSANTNVAELGEALKLVAPISAGLGVSLEETTAAINTLSDAGLKGTLAGTGLRRVLAELESPSQRTQKIFRQLGIEAEDVRISQVGLTQALKTLAEAGVDTGLALEIFQQRGGPAFEVLANAIPKVEGMTERLRESEGTARRVAEIMDDNLNGALLRVRSAIEAVLLSIGDADTAMGKVLVKAVNSLATGIRFLAQHTGVLAGVLAGIAVTQLPLVISGVRKLFVLIATHPFGALALALGVVIGYLVEFQDEIQISQDGVATLRDLFAEVGAVLKETFAGALQIFREVFGGLKAEAQGAVGDVNLSLRSVADTVALVYDSFVGFFTGVFTTIRTVFSKLPAAIGDYFVQAVNLAIFAIEDLVDTTIEGINEVIKLGTDAINAVRIALGKEAISIDAYTIDPVDLGRVKNSWANAGTELGDSIREGWKISFEKATGGRDFVERVFRGAEARAESRRLGEEMAAEVVAGMGIAMGYLPGLGEFQRETAPAATAPGAPGRDREVESAERLSRAIDQVNAALEEERRILSVTGQDRRIVTDLIAIENQLRKDGIDLKAEDTQLQLASVEAQLADLDVLRAKADLLEQIKGPEEERRLQLEALNQLLADGTINQDQYNQMVAQLGLNSEQTATQLQQFVDKLKGAKQQSEQLGAAIGDALVKAIDSASDALADFALSGFQNTKDLKKAFSDLFASLAKDILKAIIKMLLFRAIFGAIGGAAGGGGGAAAGGGVPGLQAGGPVHRGAPVIVGEQGRELFVPPSQGNIVPASQAAAPPEVNVSVVNVTDPEEVTAAMGSAEGEQVILNVIQKNRHAIGRSLV
jgi:TP901 family phage tail tape measure protein